MASKFINDLDHESDLAISENLQSGNVSESHDGLSEFYWNLN